MFLIVWAGSKQACKMYTQSDLWFRALAWTLDPIARTATQSFPWPLRTTTQTQLSNQHYSGALNQAQIVRNGRIAGKAAFERANFDLHRYVCNWKEYGVHNFAQKLRVKGRKIFKHIDCWILFIKMITIVNCCFWKPPSPSQYRQLLNQK